MTDQRTDDATTDPATLGAPEQPPMDDAAGGPQAEPNDAPRPDVASKSEEIAAEMGDFA